MSYQPATKHLQDEKSRQRVSSRNKSMENHEQNNMAQTQTKEVYQRKCHTPSILIDNNTRNQAKTYDNPFHNHTNKSSNAKSKEHFQKKSRSKSRQQSKQRELPSSTMVIANDKSLQRQNKKGNQHSNKKQISSYSIKNFQPQQSTLHQYFSRQNQQNNPQNPHSVLNSKSPFKHKYHNFNGHPQKGEPFSQKHHKMGNMTTTAGNFSNIRHVKHIQSQLAHLSDSMIKSHYQEGGSFHGGFSSFNGENDRNKSSKGRKQESALGQYERESQRKHRFSTSSKKNIIKGHKKSQHSKSKLTHHEQISQTLSDPLLDEGKQYMKNYEFQKGIQIFSEILEHFTQETIKAKSGKQSQIKHSKLEVFCEAMYLKGVCHFHLNSYEQVVVNLNKLLEIEENSLYSDQNSGKKPRKNIYLFLGIAYKKLNFIDESLLILGKGLDLYPEYTDVLLLRAKLLSKQKRFYDALEDLDKCVSIDPQNIHSFISKADCLRNLSRFEEAISIFSQILEVDLNLDVLLKRAITYIESSQTQLALKDINLILQKDPKNSEAYLFKGLAYAKANETDNTTDSLLAYEQCIKYNTSKKATTKAIYEIAKIKIDMGDYYGASYTLERAGSLDIDMKVLSKLKTFVNGVECIMKKHYRRGVEILGQISKKQHLNEQIRHLLYGFRSYGNFAQQKYIAAYSDLKQLQKCGFVVDGACQYNMTVLEGIISVQDNAFEQAMAKFQEASKIRPEFGDTHVYKALCDICHYNRTPKLRAKNYHFLQSAFENVMVGLEKETNYNYYYMSALLLYNMKRFDESLEHLQEAIEKSDEHVMRHFYLRAHIRAMQGLYKECYTDLSNVLSIQKDLQDKDKTLQKDSGGSGTTKKQAKEQSDTVQEKPIIEVYLNRAKCHLLFGDKKKAFQDLQAYIAQKPLDNTVHAVAGQLLFNIGACEDAIKAYSYSPNVDKHADILLSRAKCYMVLKELNLALKDIETLVDLYGDCKDGSQIKLDFYCLSALKQASKGASTNIQSAIDAMEKCQSLASTLVSLQKNGKIFSYSDMTFYRGLFYFLKGDYIQARKQMVKSRNLKNLNKEMFQFVQQEEISEEEYEEIFENKIFVDKEIECNITLCDLMMGETDKAAGVLNSFGTWRQSKIFSGDGFQNLTQELDLTPFPTTNRLCSIFSPIVVPSELNPDGLLSFRLTFCLPCINPPAIKFDIETELIDEINMSSIESRPDAPWIKRNKHGVIFTSDMIVADLSEDEEILIENTEEMCEGEGHSQIEKGV